MYIILTSWLLLKEVMTVVSYSTVEKNIMYMSDTQTVIKQKSNYSAYQCCGSGSTWIRIDFGRLDPDPQWEGGFSSGPRWAKITEKKKKSEEMYCFEVLDVLF